MPEFILDLGSPETSRTFKELDSFTQGYIEAMFFTSTGDPDDAENGLENADVSELAPDTLARIIKDCEAFQQANADDLTEACDNGRINGYDMQRAGNDYWYTRNGHGVGYLDRDLGNVGDKLDKAAARYSERYLVRGDDGLIYLE